MITVTLPLLQKFSHPAPTQALRRGIALLLCLAAAASQLVLAAPTSGQPEPRPTANKDPLAGVKARLAKEYPEVQHVSIATYLEQYPTAKLVDVRAAEEYAVSRIPNAIHLPDRPALLRFARAHKDQTLILYCSVGARSADAAQYLQNQAQVGPVLNLAGSIFEWSNSGRLLENDAGPTDAVHPFNAWWGFRYLHKRKPASRRQLVPVR